MRLNFQASPCTTRTALGQRRRLALPEGSTAASFNTIHTRPLPRHAAMRGFTLIELLVVIVLIATLGYMVTSQLDDVGDHAKEQIARAEMANISKALKQYKRDVGDYPARQHAADFNFIFQAQEWNAGTNTYDPIDEWDIETARGWRGPYLDNTGDGYVEVSVNLGFDGSGSPIGTPVLTEPMHSVADPFARLPDGIYFVWRPCATCDPFNGVNGPEERGRPYYLFDLDQPKKARLVSAGPNGLLETGTLAAANCADIYGTATGDDIILCMQ